MHWFWRAIHRTLLVTTTILALLMIVIGIASFWVEFSFSAEDNAEGWGQSGGGFWLTVCFDEGWLELGLQLGEKMGGGFAAERRWRGGYRGYRQDGSIYGWMTISMWLPIILFAAYPTIAFIRGLYRRCRRR
jgi:hypothetical protein